MYNTIAKKVLVLTPIYINIRQYTYMHIFIYAYMYQVTYTIYT